MKKIFASLLIAVLLAGCGGKSRENVEVLLETNMGEIRLRLSDSTPLHRDNFVRLVEEGYFDSLLFHRVIENFMIQGGDPDSRSAGPGTLLGEGGPGYTVPAEFRYPELLHRRGALAAAREGDDVNPLKASAGSQFYIVWGRTFTDEQLDALQRRMDERGGVEMTPEAREVYRTEGGTPHLDGNYTVFGMVVEGLDTVEAIQRTETDDNDRPVEDVRILRASIVSSR